MPDVTIIPSQDGPYLVSEPVRLTDVGDREIPRLSQDASGAPCAGWQRNPAVDRARWSQPS